jgi:son of sevenless-like protein
MNSAGSHKNYRARLTSLKDRSIDKPVLPYLGVNLSDLTFTEDGNPTFLPTSDSPGSDPAALPTSGNSEKMINFSKFRMVSRLLQNILDFQKGDFQFQVDESLQHFLKIEWTALDNAGLYEQSKICEPRVPA